MTIKSNVIRLPNAAANPILQSSTPESLAAAAALKAAQRRAFAGDEWARAAAVLRRELDPDAFRRLAKMADRFGW